MKPLLQQNIDNWTYRTFVRGFLLGVLLFVVLTTDVHAAPIQQYSGGLVVYGDGTAGVPKYKTFDDTDGFGSEQSATAVGTTTIEWIRVAASPTRDEWIIVTRDAADAIVAQVCTGVDGGVSCGATTTITATAGTHGLRNFDVAYERSSGDALVVYGTATADELRSIQWNGTSWTGDAAITTTRTSGTVEWVELTSRPGSDQIAIGYADSNDDISAYRWSGTAVGNEATAAITTTGSTGDVRKFDVSFEGTSGDMIIAAPLAGAGTTALGHMTSAGTWTIVANTEPDNITSYIDLQEVGADDDVAMIAYGTSTSNNPTEGYELNGATPNTTTTGMVDSTVAVDTTTLTWVANYMPVSVAYLSSTYYAVGIFSDVTGADDINWWTMNSSGVWTVQADNTRTRGTVRFTDIFDYPNANKVLLLSSDANSDLWADTWDGAATGTTVWSDRTSGGAVETSLSSATTDVYDFAFRLMPLPTRISGVLYESDRSTGAAAGKTIKLAIATSSSPAVLTATTTSGGAWSFDDIGTVISAATSGTPYTLWLDGTSTKATTLLAGNASSTALNVHMYEGHLVVNGSTTASAVNLANFSVYDSTDDADILYTISGTTATTTVDFFIRQGVFTPTATFAMLGDYTNNGAFTHGSGTLQFVATTSTQYLSGTQTGTSALNDVQFIGAGDRVGRALGYWTFNSDAMTYSSATVGTSTDVSGNGHHGTLVNMSTTTSEVAGYIDNGLYFDGVNDRIAVSSSGSLDGLTTITTCAWIKPDAASASTYPMIVSDYDSTETSGWDMYLTDSGADFALGTSFWTNTSTYTFSEFDNAIAADVWTHVCARQDGDALANINLYVNGEQLTGTVTSGGAGTRVSDAGNDLNIGAHIIGVGDGYFRGVIDEVQVYDEYLTDAEIYEIYTGSDYYYYKYVHGNASTTDLTIASGTTLYATSSLTVFGDYTNSGTLIASSTSNFYLTGSGVTATGTMTDTSSFSNLVVSGAGTKTFGANASTTNFTVLSTSGEVVMPRALSVSGNYTNNSTTTGAAVAWTAQSGVAGDNDSWRGITYGNGLFVAVSNFGDRVMTSPDGIIWTARTAVGGDDAWNSVTYGNGLFVAVSQSGDRVMTSPDGINWTARTAAGDDDDWADVVFGNGLFVAVGAVLNDRVMTSPDGINWTARTAAGDDDVWHSITYGNGLFVAVGDDGSGDAVMTSPDGTTWTPRTAFSDFTDWQSVTYGNGLFVAVANAGSLRVMTSPDGTTWTSRNAAGDDDFWNSVTYGNGLFVAAGDASGAGDPIMASSDGINWTARSAAGNDDTWYSLTHSDGQFVVVGESGSRVMVSEDAFLRFTGASSQTISGNLVGASQLRTVELSGAGTKTFSSNASSTNFTVATSSTVNLPSALSIMGNYTNSGSVEAGTGVVYLSGSNPQTFTGSMTTTNAFNNIVVKNTSRVASTSFTGALTVDGTLTAEGGTFLTLLSGATSTVANLTLTGSSSAPVAFGATATGTAARLVVTGTPTVTYTTIYDNNACGSTGGVIDVSGGNNTDGGNTTCWNFIAAGVPTVSLAENLDFYVGQATTTIGTITVTDAESPSITAANDIRFSIATTTTNFRFDVGVTTLTFGGTASAKVANPVSYEDGGATLVIPVSSNFAASDTLTIDGVTVGAFNAVSTATSKLALHTDGSSVGSPAASSTEIIYITGLLTLADHTAGQTDNKFSWQNRDAATLYTFKLTPTHENVTVTDIVVTLSGLTSVVADDLTNLDLYLDGDSDGVYDTGETLIDGSGILTLNGQYGAITFSSDFSATTTRDYIVIGDTTTIAPGASAVFSIAPSGVTGTGVTSAQPIAVGGSVSTIQHIRNTSGGGGSNSSRLGDAPPAGAGTVTGGEAGGGGSAGEEEEGENIAFDADYYRPTDVGAPSEWTNPSNGYVSDGAYATASTNSFRQTYINFGFGIPTNNSIQGISVKIDASGSTAAGSIDIALSWDGGSSYTTAKATPTVAGSDIVYTVGGPGDTWGRSWSVDEFSNANFRLRVTANTSSNTLRIDALELRVHHQAGGGGSGGGGGI